MDKKELIMNNILEYYDFLLEDARIDEGILKSWNEKKFIVEIKGFLKRYHNKTVLRNMKDGDRKSNLIKLNDLYTKYEAGDESVKAEMLELGKSFLDKKKSVTGYSADPMIKTKYHG